MNTPSETRRAGVLAVHSVDHVAFTVPALAEAERFFTAFGLDARRAGGRLDVRAHGAAHRWLAIHEAGTAKQL